MMETKKEAAVQAADVDELNSSVIDLLNYKIKKSFQVWRDFF